VNILAKYWFWVEYLMPEFWMLRTTEPRLYACQLHTYSCLHYALSNRQPIKQCLMFLPGYGPIAIADWSIIVHCHLLHEGIFPKWTKSDYWESFFVAFHSWNSQWSLVSILYQNIKALYICPHILVPFAFGTKSQLVSFSLALKNCVHFSVQFTWILCLIWWNLQLLDR
jgi:hypothetical protein